VAIINPVGKQNNKIGVGVFGYWQFYIKRYKRYVPEGEKK